MTFLIISGCAGGGEEEATSPDTNDDAAYTQTDLAGTWRIHKLANDPRWTRATFTVNESGVVSCVSYEDSTGANVCPASFDLQWTVANGAITASGDNAGSDVHMTMTSNFKLIAGTGTGSDESRELIVAQRIGTGYGSGDVQGKSFVFHQLSTGTNKEWRYGAGATDSSGLITMTSETGPNDNAMKLTGVTISSDVNGAVSMNGGDITNFSGYLSNDKKTIVGTYTSGSDFTLIIIQITGQTYTAGALPAGGWNAHCLAVGNLTVSVLGMDIDITPFWLHYAATVDNNGTISFSNWVSSNSLVTEQDSPTATISASGEITLNDSTNFNGQGSDDSTFMVATQTPEENVYSLTIYTDAP